MQTVSTTVEIRVGSPAGETVELVNQETTEHAADQSLDIPVNGIVGISEEPIQMQVQARPQLFDMDLEHMHLDLYKSKYMTPDDFLDDIRKIVHNANVRADEDAERLFRAQAMLTAAEVSIQDFDPQFRQECERMAARESKRREAARKAREKSRAASGTPPINGSEVYAPGTRRSARHNGLQPELSITDPLLLERRLKRQRSAEANSEDQEMDGRGSKRSRVSSNELDGHSPMDVQMGTPPPRPHAVRFTDDMPQQPRTPTPSGDLSVPPSIIEQQSQPSGFGDLLNPMRPEEVPFPPDSTQLPVVADQVPPDMPTGPIVPEVGPPAPAPVDGVDSDGMTLASKTELLDTPPRFFLADDANAHDMHIDEPSSAPIDQHVDEGAQQPSPAAEPASEVPEVPMEIERTPTPLPDFEVDSEALAGLKTDLRDRTYTLNVEQLEQLRASCLGCVWRHRSEWNRTALVQELRDTVRDFVDEASVDDADATSPV